MELWMKGTEKIIELLQSEYEVISEFCDAAIDSIKGPLERATPDIIPGFDEKGWGKRQPWWKYTKTMNDFFDSQATWSYSLRKNQKPLVDVWIGIIIGKPAWKFATS